MTKLSIGIVPQDPVLFSGTVRSNLDPFSNHCDSDVTDALRKACMYEYVMEGGGGLDMKVENNGDNFSVGQRQLLCLARAVLRKPKILVCDEHSASIDPMTDRIIGEVLRTTFKVRRGNGGPLLLSFLCPTLRVSHQSLVGRYDNRDRAQDTERH